MVLEEPLEAVVEGFTRDKLEHAGVSDAMKLSQWAVKEDSLKAYAEPYCLATLRLTIAGCREVILARWEDMWAFLVKVQQIEASKITTGRAALFLQQADAATLERFLAKFPLFYATVSGWQTIYQPAGWITVERSKPAADVVGVCMRGFTIGDAVAKRFFKHYANHLESANTSPEQPELLAMRACIEQCTSMTPSIEEATAASAPK
eukprot:3348414-Amphidinium_carterae.2